MKITDISIRSKDCPILAETMEANKGGREVPNDIIFCDNGMALVRDEDGKQITKYQKGYHIDTILSLWGDGIDWKTIPNRYGHPLIIAQALVDHNGYDNAIRDAIARRLPFSEQVMFDEKNHPLPPPTMTDIKLGSLIAGEARRDAIHVALAPVTAGEELMPGEHVGLNSDGQAVTTATKCIGIVDPFLTKRVAPGEKFWMLLYQFTVTGMRHQWSHPDFQEEHQGPTEAMRKAAKDWISDFAREHSKSYYQMMDAARGWIENEDYFVGGDEFEGVSVPDTFWVHYEVLTGKRGTGSFFSCSC